MPNILMIINKLVFQFYHKCCLSVNNPLLKCGAITQGIEVATGLKCIFELEKENIIAKMKTQTRPGVQQCQAQGQVFCP